MIFSLEGHFEKRKFDPTVREDLLAYKKFITSCGLDTQQTPDRIKYRSLKLDYAALNDMMKELIEEAK
jgi:hypothetical protein